MSGITMEEMKNISANIDLSSDIGNVIDIGGLNDFSINDDLGMSLLMNNKPGSGQQQQQQHQQNTFSFSPQQHPQQQEPQIDITPLQPMEFSIPTEPLPGLQEFSISHDKPTEPIQFDNFQSSSQSSQAFTMAPPRDLEAERTKKVQFLNKLQRLENKGFPISKRFTQDNSLEEIESEYNRLVDARNMESSIKFQRQMMMGFVTGAEYLNNKFNPLDIELDGWSESVHENVEDFDEIFEDLYDKYKERGKMAPEMRLVMALAGSGFMFHVSNSFFRQKMPSMENVMKANPDLMRQMAAAAANQVGGGFGNFMGAAMGLPQQQQQQPQPPTGAFFASSGAMPQSPSSQQQSNVARKEMKGPSDVDDILKTFEEVRRAEMNSFSHPSPVPNMSSGGTPSQSAVYGAAVSSASDLQSVMSEELQSVADSQFTKGTNSGGRNRKKKQPVGNTVSLNV